MKRLALTASVLALALTASFAGPVKDRQAFMKENGKLVGQLVPVAKGEKAFDAAEVKTLLAAFGEHTQKLDVEAFFPEGSTEGKTAPRRRSGRTSMISRPRPRS